MKNKNLWILTEERPKREVIANILMMFAKNNEFVCFVDTIRILPILENGKFSFLYEVVGFRCNKIERVFIKSVSGFGSFVDFLIFFQEKQPIQTDLPIYAIEETKTDDKESRNTGVYQRASKFVFIEKYYPKIKKVMLYNLQIEQKEIPTATYIFGTRLLLTLGVEILGKKLDSKIFQPFHSLDEIIALKKAMRKAHKGNVPILIKKIGNKITVSGRLYKSDGLAHDPNIGALSLICAVIRELGWDGEIIITKHGLKQKHIQTDNKFIKIANKLNIKIHGLLIPVSKHRDNYWKYETEGEKLGTIFIHLVVENFTEGYAIFENHAGCEKGYFITSDGKHIPLEKYSDRKAYKAGNKNKIISIPDLILIDFGRSEIVNIEGKKYQFRQDGIKELKGFGDIEKTYIKKYYPKFKITRTVVLYGGTKTKIIEIEVGFLLNENGDLILGMKAPKLFKEAIKNLLDFWL
ncbi:MAG: hypothetical protein PHE59_01170 [Patescibacteria group bacterium]|nr:hypothetical protein [Patescibacteria group bacterium]MDD5164282.1 hypothetical protein [Patescibacteria group bacterium]MDD5535037.1 hypothetical protein [Patescibacteria group bacterium]